MEEYFNERPEQTREQHLQLIKRLVGDYVAFGFTDLDAFVAESVDIFEAELYEEASLLARGYRR
jgi:hypothetical protein